MIGKVLRGRDLGGLLRYLFGPGRHNEHTDPHLVAHWNGLPADAVSAPGAAAGLRGLIQDLTTDLAAAGTLGRSATVWHCSVSLPAGDGRLSDARWRAAAERIVAEVGLEDDHAGAVRWVAVRHGTSVNGNDHIHLVAALAGRTAHGTLTDRTHLHADYAAVRRACTHLETQWRLTRTGTGTGAAHRRPQRPEREIAARRRMRTPQRIRLERAVRSAAVASRGPNEFCARLAAEGVTARFTRPSTRRHGTWLGVTFTTADYTTTSGRPVAFSGRKLAADLTAPALQARWDTSDVAASGVPVAGSTGQLIAALADHLRAAAVTGAELPALRGVVRAGADGLWAAAEAVEADRGGGWHTAAGEAARAAREPGTVDERIAARLRVITIGLGRRPRAQSKADAELARAHEVFTHLLRIWAHKDRGEPARVAAAAATRIAAVTATSAAAVVPAGRGHATSDRPAADLHTSRPRRVP